MAFPLRYGTTCAECDEWMPPGTEARYFGAQSSAGIVHYPRCPTPVVAVPRPVCSRCTMELPVSGICGECD